MSDELAPVDGPLDRGTIDVPQEHQERKAKIMQMRRTGATFEVIGQAVGLTRQRVHQIYKQALGEIPVEEVRLYRMEQVERLDGLLAVAMGVLARKHVTVSNGKVVTLDGEPIEDDGPTLEAIRTVLSIEERRAKLLGLDTPVKAQIDTNTRITYAFEGVNLEALR